MKRWSMESWWEGRTIGGGRRIKLVKVFSCATGGKSQAALPPFYPSFSEHKIVAEDLTGLGMHAEEKALYHPRLSRLEHEEKMVGKEKERQRLLTLSPDIMEANKVFSPQFPPTRPSELLGIRPSHLHARNQRFPLSCGVLHKRCLPARIAPPGQ